jgi:hypothetical protein
MSIDFWRFYSGTALNGFSRSHPILFRFYLETDAAYVKPVEALLFPCDTKEVREGQRFSDVDY